MKYYVEIGGTTREVELTPEGVVLDSEGVEAELASVPGGALRHLRLGDRGFLLSAVREEDGWEVRVAGRRYRVRVEDERTRAVRELAGREESGAGGHDLRAPMPGKVVRILVEEGQEVEAGDGLVVMEAMKMENELTARTAGRVGSLRVEEGRTVNQGDLLAVIEEGGVG